MLGEIMEPEPVQNQGNHKIFEKERTFPFLELISKGEHHVSDTSSLETAKSV